MTNTPTPAEIEILRAANSDWRNPKITAILDRLSPAPEPEVDEATVWTDRVVAVLNATLPMGDTRSQEDLARAVIAELIASKDGEIKRWHNAYEIAHDQAMSNGSSLATLRAENERLIASKDNYRKVADAIESGEHLKEGR